MAIEDPAGGGIAEHRGPVLRGSQPAAGKAVAELTGSGDVAAKANPHRPCALPFSGFVLS